MILSKGLNCSRLAAVMTTEMSDVTIFHRFWAIVLGSVEK